MLPRLLYYTFFVSSLLGCSLLLKGTSALPQKDPQLKVTLETPGWAPTDPRESDFAWAHRGRGDVLMVNSFCGQFQALPLETLALKTFQGYEGFRPLGSRELSWLDRDAFELEAEAKVDGVKVLLHLRNYRRDHCYYDFILITPREQHPQSLEAFEHMITGVKFL